MRIGNNQFSAVSKFWPGVVLFSILGLMMLVVWLNRAGFINKFDYDYVRYFYDHSHWTVPASQRKMGDALLYQIAGYELLTKHSYTEINPEAPPLGKYLIGGSIILTGSALWINIPLFLLLLWFSYLVAAQIFKKSWQKWLSIWLIAWQPIVWQQLYQSMLDLGQTTWLMAWLWLVMVLASAQTLKRQFLSSLGAGLFLGLFMSTKIAFFIVPLLVLLGGWLVFLKKIRWILIILVVAGLTYASFYLPHLLISGISEAISLQKWIINYWLSSGSKPVYGITLLVLATGWYLGHWHQATWQWLTTWNPTWFIGSVLTIFVLIFDQRLKTKINHPLITLLLGLIALIISLSLVPLFDRYLITIVPLLSITSIHIISFFKTRWRLVLTTIIVSWTVVQSVWLLPPSLIESSKEIARIASVPAYQDLWSFVDLDTQQTYSRSQFWQQLEIVRSQARLQQVNWAIVLPPEANSWLKNVPVTIKIKQQTLLGDLNYSVRSKLVRRNGGWYLVWTPDLFLKGWQPNSQVKLKLSYDQNGRVINSTGEILSEQGLVPAVWITPGQIKNELLLNKQVEQLTGISKPDQELLYKVGQLPLSAQYIGQVQPFVSQNLLTDLDPGIVIASASGRVYHPLIARHKEQVQKLMQIEKDESRLLTYPSGQLVILHAEADKNFNDQVLLEVDPAPQHNLHLKQDFLSVSE